MPVRKRDRSLGSGVYYAPGDYVGILRRIAIWVIDAFVLLCLLFGLGTVWSAVAPESPGPYLLTSLILVWLYVAVLKPSKLRTVGYWLTGCRIVNLRGESPSVLRMTLRSLMWMLGPFSPIFDLIWCGIDEDRQGLRDRFVGTCLIKRDATPIGQGEIHLAHFNAMGYTLMYPHVVHPRHELNGSIGS